MTVHRAVTPEPAPPVQRPSKEPVGGICEFCGKPDTADHWRRISRGWERIAWSVAITALIVGSGVGFVLGWAVFSG